MVGLPWPQHIPFLDDPRLARQIRHDAATAVRRLGIAPGGADVRRRQRDPARRSCAGTASGASSDSCASCIGSVKAAAPESLLTYVNFPPTEYLELDCFDVCAFNVYLHREAGSARVSRAAAAHRRREAAAAGRSRRRQRARGPRRSGAHHRDARARGLRRRRLRRGRVLLDRRMVARRSLPSTTGPSASSTPRGNRSRRWRRSRQAFAEAPFPARGARASGRRCRWWSARTTPPTRSTTVSRSLATLTYPSVEVIVVNDGSRDATASIARRHRRACASSTCRTAG